jgi:HK97 gp10 family phage protein
MAADVTGLAAALASLDAVPKALRKKLLKKAVTLASRRVTRQAKANIKGVGTGLLKRSLGQKLKSYQGGEVQVGLVGPRKGFATVVRGRKADPVRYSHFVEKGTRPHSVKSGAALARRGKADVGQTGRMHPGAQARPFLMPAGRAVSAGAKAEMADLLRAGIEAAAKGGAA